MTLASLGSPTTQLPPIRKIKSSSVADLHQAIHYLTLLYNPEVCGSRFTDRRPCSLRSGARPRSPCSPRRRLQPLKSQVGTEADLAVIRADAFEQEYAVRWLTILISQATLLEEDTEDVEALIQDAASLPAICAGAAAAGTRSRTFTFASELKVMVTVLPIDNQDYSSVGAQTWGGACLLADMITQVPMQFGLPPSQEGRRLRILELGAGTGLVSLAVGKLLDAMESDAEIVATDFQPAVLENLGRNIATNFPPSPSTVAISAHFLDWSHIPALRTPPFDDLFDVIYGADIIYELDHARWVKTCVERFLRKPSSASTHEPRFQLVLPLRSTHSAESHTVEEVFPFAPAVRPGWGSRDGPGHVIDDAELTLAITAKEAILCEDAVWSRGKKEVEYVHYVISWV